jgi:hypothetical protein
MAEDHQEKWNEVLVYVEGIFNKKPDMEGLLFIIGMRELGDSTGREFTKEEKVKLMDIALCRVLSFSGYYTLAGKDEAGWPIWENEVKLPFLNIFEQETFLRHHIISYFEEEQILPQ